MANSVLAKMAVQIAANTAQFNSQLSQSQKQFSGFANSIQNTAKGLIAGFGLLEIGSQVIKTTGEFQRFEAVLSNTLGSESKAQRALKDIKDFASATPFAVNELTGAFVKLANQGFVPTTNELKKLGDLASSTGKGFDQLAEAIIDAQVGEFERLKEFGVRAKKEGDKVTFTFKGVKQQVDFTSESIQQYILSLGDAVGVSGSMEKISATLEGRISNLGDAWDSLMLSIGTGTSGPLFGAVESLTKLTTAAANFRQELALIGQAVSPFHDLRDVSKETLDYLMKFGRTDSGKAVADILKPFTSQDAVTALKNFDNNHKNFIDTLVKEGESVNDANVLWQRYIETQIEVAKAQKESFSEERIAAVQKEIELAKERLKVARDQAAITRHSKSPLASPTDSRGTLTQVEVDPLEIGMSAEEGFSMAQDALSKYVNDANWEKWNKNQNMIEQQTQNTIEQVISMSSIFGNAFASIISGSQNAAQAFGQASSQIVDSIGRMIMAKMINKAIDDKATDFNFFAKLALIGVATSTASALLRKIGKSSGSGGGSGISTSTQSHYGSNGYASAIPIEISFTGDAGKVMKAMIVQEDRRSSRIKVG